MKVLLSRPKIDRGGASRVIIQLSKGLSNRGIEVFVASSGGEWLHLLDGFATFLQVPLFPTSVPNLIRSSALLSKIVKLKSIDIVNTHHRFAALSSKWLSKVGRVPHVSTVHEIKKDKPTISKFALGDLSIVFSHAVKNHLLKSYQINSDRVSVVPMGIEPGTHSDQINERKIQELGLSNKIPIVASIARFSLEKGCRYYLQAAALVKAAGRDVQFMLVGDGPEKEDLEVLARNLNLGSSMKIVPWQEEIRGVIGVSSFLILPSLTEAFGMVILEGYSLSKPTIASNVDGIKEVIINNETGILVPPGDPGELADAIIELLENEHLSQQYGTRGNELFMDQFTPKVMVEQTLTTFSRLLEQ